jgi:hypothetical protein
MLSQARAQNKKAAGQTPAHARNGLNGSFASERPTLGAFGFLKSRNRATSDYLKYFLYYK